MIWLPILQCCLSLSATPQFKRAAQKIEQTVPLASIRKSISSLGDVEVTDTRFLGVNPLLSDDKHPIYLINSKSVRAQFVIYIKLDTDMDRQQLEQFLNSKDKPSRAIQAVRVLQTAKVSR